MIKKCEYGTIEYRLPNIPEAMEFMGMLGLNSGNADDSEWLQDNDLMISARAIKHLDLFIDKIDIVINEKNITSYEDLLKEFDMMTTLSELSTTIMGSMQSVSKGGKKGKKK